MKYTIYGKNMHVSDNVKETFKNKFKKFDRYFEDDVNVYATFNQQKHNQIVEVTIPLGPTDLRAECSAKELKSAIEKAVDRIEGQLRKHKTKLKRQYNDELSKFNVDLIEEVDEPEDVRKVVRTKRFPIKPMSVEEATLQMDLLGHDFFVFLNADTDDVNVVYLRKDGNYGLIEPYI